MERVEETASNQKQGTRSYLSTNATGTHIYTYIDMSACRLVGVLSRKGHGMDATRTVLDWTHLSKMFALIQDGRFLPDPVACNMSPLGRRRGPALRA